MKFGNYKQNATLLRAECVRDVNVPKGGYMSRFIEAAWQYQYRDETLVVRIEFPHGKLGIPATYEGTPIPQYVDGCGESLVVYEAPEMHGEITQVFIFPIDIDGERPRTELAVIGAESPSQVGVMIKHPQICGTIHYIPETCVQ